jgi:hypothetical protein
VGVKVGVDDDENVGVTENVLVAEVVAVREDVREIEGVDENVGVAEKVGVRENVGVAEKVGVRENVGVLEGVGLGEGVTLGLATPYTLPPAATHTVPSVPIAADVVMAAPTLTLQTTAPVLDLKAYSLPSADPTNMLPSLPNTPLAVTDPPVVVVQFNVAVVRLYAYEYTFPSLRPAIDTPPAVNTGVAVKDVPVISEIQWYVDPAASKTFM